MRHKGRGGLYQDIGKNVKIKAAGGIHTKKEMEDFLAAGCDRIGASGAVKAYLKEKGM